MLVPLLSAFCGVAGDNDLYSRKWWLKKIYTPEGTRLIEEKKPFIRFDKEQKSAGGNGGCNSFGSTLSVKNGTLSITEIISTKMYCEAVQPLEDLFLSHLYQARRYTIRGNTLVLSNEKKELLLEFEGEPISEQ